jgi:hypothetical protein
MGRNTTYAHNPTGSSGATYRPAPAGIDQQNPLVRRSNSDGFAESIQLGAPAPAVHRGGFR